MIGTGLAATLLCLGGSDGLCRPELVWEPVWEGMVVDGIQRRLHIGRSGSVVQYYYHVGSMHLLKVMSGPSRVSVSNPSKLPRLFSKG